MGYICKRFEFLQGRRNVSGKPAFAVKLSIALVCSVNVIAIASSARAEIRKSKDARAKTFSLSLIGFNYTDRNIADYSVNGVSGGHVFMSSPTSGGSGEVCCVKIINDIESLNEIRLRWQYGGCKYLVESISGRTYDQRHFFYREITVRSSVLPGKPLYLETHFYPSGSVKVMLTEWPSLPLVVRDEKREDLSNFQRCKDEKKPTR